MKDIIWQRSDLDLMSKPQMAQILLDALPCIALLVTSDKVVVGSNKKAADLGMVPGTVCHTAWSGRQEPCVGCRADDCLQDGLMQREEVQVGEDCWECYWMPVNSDLYVHYAFDVSDRKQLERKLKAYAERLEFLNRELREFSFVASHDLQEPLRKIQAFGNLLEIRFGDCLGEHGGDYLTRMIRSAKGMSALFDALLNYSLMAEDPQTCVSVNIGEIVHHVVEDLQSWLAQKGGEVDIAQLPSIEADPNQMRQLFRNLISNAIKYGHTDRKVKIKVHGQAIGGLCTLYVEDNGIGFDQKYLNLIFRPFQRLHAKSEYEGTGMGLAICRRIADRHGGGITAKSVPGQGAIFIITLPIRQGGIYGT